MASLLSIINYVMSVVFIVLLFAIILANGVYTRDRRKDLSNVSTEEDKDRRSTHSRLQKTENTSAGIWILPPRREPFQRILVLCNNDNECDRKSFCHGGEGHKSCLPCRRSRRRCQRNGMCCHGNICQQGRCIPKERRYDKSYPKTSQSYIEEESISQHTKDNMRKRREDEVCDSSEQCGDGLCCAQHFWTRICKRILVQGDVCTKKRDRHTDVFQRCNCGESLSCKRHPVRDERYHTCQFIKGGKRVEIENGEERYEDGVVLTLLSEKQGKLHMDKQLPANRQQPDWYDRKALTDNGASDTMTEIIDYDSDDQSEYKEDMDTGWDNGNTVDEDKQGKVEDQQLEDVTHHLSSWPTGNSWIKAESSVQPGTETTVIL